MNKVITLLIVVLTIIACGPNNQATIKVEEKPEILSPIVIPTPTPFLPRTIPTPSPTQTPVKIIKEVEIIKPIEVIK